MKVNISYAVELEDVPAEVGKLITNVGLSLAFLLNDVEEIATSNPTSSIEEIAKIREKLKDLDLRLADCSNILGGYIDIQSNSVSESIPLEVEDGPSV